jgi:hypothetical protein
MLHANAILQSQKGMAEPLSPVLTYISNTVTTLHSDTDQLTLSTSHMCIFFIFSGNLWTPESSRAVHFSDTLPADKRIYANQGPPPPSPFVVERFQQVRKNAEISEFTKN